MKKLLLAVVAVVSFAPAAFADYVDHATGARVLENVYGQQQRAPQTNDVYFANGTYLGTDPDPFIRQQLMRDPTGTGDVAPE